MLKAIKLGQQLTKNEMKNVKGGVTGPSGGGYGTDCAFYSGNFCKSPYICGQVSPGRYICTAP